MRAVRTKASNHDLGAPLGREASVLSLPCQIDTTVGGPDDGQVVVYSVWEPSDEERAAIAAGENVRLGVWWVGVFPPVSIGVTGEPVIERPWADE
jgi:hypothetical protein